MPSALPLLRTCFGKVYALDEKTKSLIRGYLEKARKNLRLLRSSLTLESTRTPFHGPITLRFMPLRLFFSREGRKPQRIREFSRSLASCSLLPVSWIGNLANTWHVLRMYGKVAITKSFPSPMKKLPARCFRQLESSCTLHEDTLPPGGTRSEVS